MDKPAEHSSPCWVDYDSLLIELRLADVLWSLGI